MPEISPTTRSFASELESVILSKNPLSVLFGLARLRELFEDLADDLLSGIEKAYYEESAGEFTSLIETYEKNGFYKVIYAFYQDHSAGIFEAQRARLDDYFEESYWRDVDFYFFVLDKHPELHAKFEILRTFFDSPCEIDAYLAISNTEDRISFLQKIGESLGLSVADFVGTQACSEFFRVLLPEVQRLHTTQWCGPLKSSRVTARRVIRDIYLLMISDRTGERVDFWRTYFIENAPVNQCLLESLQDFEVTDCFKFLRTKLLKTPKYNLALSDTSSYRIFINRADTLVRAPIAQKLDLLADIHEKMGTDSIRREQFQNVLRKGLMYNSSIDLVDTVLGITFLKRVAFYEVKRRVMTVDFSEYVFESLAQVTGLIRMLDSSLVLRFFRPFFMRRLSKVFNKKADYYYFIKFILTIHSSKTYNEYMRLSSFFLSLEAFEKRGIYGFFLQFIQFGWTAIVL